MYQRTRADDGSAFIETDTLTHITPGVLITISKDEPGGAELFLTDAEARVVRDHLINISKEGQL